MQHDGKDIRQGEWRNFCRQYVLFCRNVEDGEEDDEQSFLLNLLPEAWVKRAPKQQAKRVKSKQTVELMLNKEQNKLVVSWTRSNVARDLKRQSLRNALLFTVLVGCEKAAIWCLDKCEVGGQKSCLQDIPWWSS